jgi:hypothetical protein
MSSDRQIPSPITTITSRARRTPFLWDQGTVYIDFLLALCDHVKRGKRADSSFKKTTWTEILVHLNSKGHNIPNWEALKTKHNAVKKLYREWIALCNASSFGRDKDTGAITASDECWTAYLEVCNFTISKLADLINSYRNILRHLDGVINLSSMKIFWIIYTLMH